MTGSDFEAAIFAELSGKLTSEYQLYPQYQSGTITSLDLKGNPDMVLVDREDPDNLTLIEIKTSPQHGSVPESTLDQMRAYRHENAAYHPRLILVTNGSVSPRFERACAEEDIALVKTSNVSTAAAAILETLKKTETMP